MKRTTRTSGWTVLGLSVSVLFAPTALGVNYVVDGLNGDDNNPGISATGGPSSLAALDFSEAFKTIAQATSVTAPGDFVFVKDGEYPEEVVPSEGTTLMAVGEVVIPNVNSAFRINVTEVTVDGFTITNAGWGVNRAGHTTATVLRNLTITNCYRGISYDSDPITIRRCVIMGCATAAIATASTSPTAFIEQCTLVGNATGAAGVQGAGTTFRNNIVAFNTGDGISGAGGALIDFNDVFENGTNYSGVSPGPNDMSVDPQFVDWARRILHLQPGSPLINAGEELGGGPRVTIGGRDIGHASSDTLNAWVDWMDSNGNALELCSISTADVCIEDASGHLILNTGVNRATVISVVFDGSLKSVEFAALEDLTPPPGMRKVIDADDTTFQRELEFRGSGSSFVPTAAAPAWNPIFEGQVLESIFRFVQVRMTLTTNGL